jgi:N-acetylmuramoyl-L-alanine amidase
MHGKERISESEYVYDVAMRVARMIRTRGGLAPLTVKDGPESDNPANKIIPTNRTGRFALDGTLVRAGSTGLRKRLAYGNMMAKKYPRHHKAWISIHFDVTGKSTGIEGVRIISPGNNGKLVKALERTFGSAHRLREGDPVVESGDPDHGLRHIFVLSSRNQIRDRVLIELGNFLNDKDAWRIRDPKTRESYALLVVKALEQY